MQLGSKDSETVEPICYLSMLMSNIVIVTIILGYNDGYLCQNLA